MGRLKIPVLILLTLVLLTVGAALPAIAAAVQDRTTVNHSGFGEIESLKLEFSRPESTDSLLGKLALIRDGSFYTVSPSKTRIRQSQIEDLVNDGLALYYQAELIPYNRENWEFSAEPHLVFNDADKDTYAVVWVVSIHWPEQGGDLSLYVEDETGAILYVHYNSPDPLDVYTVQGYMDALSGAFFASSGISGILAEPEAYGVEWITADDAGANAQTDKYNVYSICHPAYGVLEIQFWIYQRGFYTTIR